MKKLLVLVSCLGKKKVKTQSELGLLGYLRQNLPANIELTIATFSDLVFKIRKGKVAPYVGEKNILDFDLVWFRTVGGANLAIANSLAVVLKKNNCRFFDTFRARGGYFSKLASYVELAQANLPVPPSIFCAGENILKQRKAIIRQFDFPLVAKNIWRNRGAGVFLIEKEKDFLTLFSEGKKKGQFLFQKFYPNDGDYRIVVLGDQVWAWEKRSRINERFRNNAALGGKEEFFPVKNIPPEMAKISIKAAKVLDLEVAGVDVLAEKGSGGLWILEVNIGPAFTADLKISPERLVVTKFIKNELTKSEA